MSASVLIQSLIRRAGGSKIPLFGKEYEFTPQDPKDPDSIHVCAIPVEDAKAIHRLREIPEGFKVLSDAASVPAKPKDIPAQTVHTEKPETPAEQDPAPAPQEAPQGESTDVFLESPDGEKINLSAMTRDELDSFARDNFKIRPHHKQSDAVLIAKIVAAARGEE